MKGLGMYVANNKQTTTGRGLWTQCTGFFSQSEQQRVPKKEIKTSWLYRDSSYAHPSTNIDYM